MRVAELLEDSPAIKPLKLRRDNPGGKWQEEKREISTEAGLNQWGSPARFGTVTGYFDRRVLLPVRVLAKLHGVNGEHYRTRHDDLDGLKDYMGKNNRLPAFSKEEPHKQYVPFVTVYQDGTPYINEGNHRIKAAAALGWEYLPIDLRYFNGAEGEAGPLAPPLVIEYDRKAQEAGYTPDDSFKPM